MRDGGGWPLLRAGGTRRAGRGRTLRILSAQELLEAGREADALAEREGERALCANACILARALERRGRPVYPDGGAALRDMSAAEIERLAGEWAALDWEENPSPEDGEGRWQALKKALSTRLTRGSSGAC